MQKNKKYERIYFFGIFFYFFDLLALRAGQKNIKILYFFDIFLFFCYGEGQKNIGRRPGSYIFLFFYFFIFLVSEEVKKIKK